MRYLVKTILLATLLAFTPAFAGAVEGDIKKGQKVFKKCAACHSVEEGGKSKIGPNLWNIVGAEAGGKDSFKYSKALLEAGLTWDEATLDVWLTKPKKLVKGTKMIFVGLKKQKQRDNVIAYLKTLK